MAIDGVFSETIIAKLTSNSSGQRTKRVRTITRILSNAALYLLYFFTAYIIFSMLGVPIGTLLAGAGIIGVAIGFGAQQLVADVITGFFILFENHFEVGDWIELPEEDISGQVIMLGIRSTQLKAASGEVFFIPNSFIKIVNNQSRSHRKIDINIPLSNQNDFTALENLIVSVTQEIQSSYANQIQDDPILLGLYPTRHGNFVYRISFLVTNGQQYGLEGQINRAYIKALNENGFTLPNFLDG